MYIIIFSYLIIPASTVLNEFQCPGSCDLSQCPVRKDGCLLANVNPVNGTSVGNCDDCCPKCAKNLCDPAFTGNLTDCPDGLKLSTITTTTGKAKDETVSNTDSDCVAVTCPSVESSNRCQNDSHLVESSDSGDVVSVRNKKCCQQTASKCVCKSENTCPVPGCPTGQKLVIVKKGTTTPGSCCDNYTCAIEKHGPSRRNVSTEVRTSCEYNGTRYQDGATWSNGNCTECWCKHGLAYCKDAVCPRLTCDFPVTRDGECCSVCEGCLAPDGVSRADSEEWREDDCVQCRCQNGQIRCHVEECQVNCATENSVKLPGQCCPVCNNDTARKSLILQPAHCVPLGKCKRLCRHGYTKHADGCFRCECEIENCTLSCEFGYETDPVTDEGRCECVKNNLELVTHQPIPTACKNVTSCNSSSCSIVRRHSDGCLLCDCPTPACPEFRIDDCPRECDLGYKYDAKHCLTCECIQPPVTPASENKEEETAATTARPVLNTPQSCDESEEDSIPWTEGCHECLCFRKRKMCDVILTMANSTGQICSPKSTEGQVQLVLPGFCDTSDSSASQTLCTECVCISGVIYCAELQCPVLHCTGTLVQYPNQCCPSCHFYRSPIAVDTDNHATTSTATAVMDGLSEIKGLRTTARRKVKCQVSDNEIHESGTTWWQTPCRSCSCDDGAVRCTQVRCPALDCEFVTLQMGHCCPTCFNSTAPPVNDCQYARQTYRSGDTWSQPECLICTCLEGIIVCKQDGLCGSERKILVKLEPEMDPETVNKHPGKAVWMIVIFIIIFGAAGLGLFLLVKRCRRNSPRRGHLFAALPTSEHSSGSHQGSQTPLSKSHTITNSCFP